MILVFPGKVKAEDCKSPHIQQHASHILAPSAVYTRERFLVGWFSWIEVNCKGIPNPMIYEIETKRKWAFPLRFKIVFDKGLYYERNRGWRRVIWNAHFYYPSFLKQTLYIRAGLWTCRDGGESEEFPIPQDYLEYVILARKTIYNLGLPGVKNYITNAGKPEPGKDEGDPFNPLNGNFFTEEVDFTCFSGRELFEFRRFFSNLDHRVEFSLFKRVGEEIVYEDLDTVASF
jgi:hypothetical protein